MIKQRASRAATIAATLLFGMVAVSSAADCDRLPSSALRTRSCNPQNECLRGIPKGAKGGTLDARQKECSRLPTSGVCHGPDSYNPQADCRSGQRKK